MTGKLFGVLMLICGAAGAVILWLLSKSARHSHEKAAVRRFKLDHEYENKGFTEKGQSEGITDVPKESSSAPNKLFENDPYFSSSTDTQRDNTPGDNF